MMRECELNLIPTDIIDRDSRRARVRFWISLVIGCLLFLSFVNIVIKIVNNSMAKNVAALASASKELSGKMEEIQQLDMREKELRNIKDRIDHLSKKGPLMETFTAIDKAINDNITLTHLEARYNYPGTSYPEGKKESDGKGYFSSAVPAKVSGGQTADTNSVILQGSASSNTDLASLITQLSGQSLFKKVNLRYSRTGESEKGKLMMFEIECRL